MNAQNVSQGLSILQTQLASILDPATAERALERARTDVVFSEHRYNEFCARTDYSHDIVEVGWGFAIKDPPLRFGETQISRYPFRVDIICDFRWKNDVPTPCKRDIVLRLWALDPDMIYRERWDSDLIGDLATGPVECLGERVMLRFHFEKARPGVSELRDHMHVGGTAREDEYCWLPPQIDVPRFPYPPVDLFLACELIGANFYGHEYNRIRTDSNWVGQVHSSQEMLLQEYYDGCLRAIRDKKSVLMDHLWQR